MTPENAELCANVLAINTWLAMHPSRRIESSTIAAGHAKVARQAADRIESLAAERDSARELRDRFATEAERAEATLSERIASHEVCLGLVRELRGKWERATAERDAIYRFARLSGLLAIDIQNAVDAALAAKVERKDVDWEIEP